MGNGPLKGTCVTGSCLSCRYHYHGAQARADNGEATNEINFNNANSGSSICRANGGASGGTSTCNSVTPVGTTGFRVSGNVGKPGSVPNAPTSVSGLPEAVTLTYGILVW